MKALDLFRGAGGWSLGGRWVGLEDDGVEIMDAANATATAAGFTTVHKDVWTFDHGRLGDYVGQITSPPCQTFSMSGKGSGRKALDDVLSLLPHVEFMTLADLQRAGERFGDPRTGLVLTPLWYALHAPSTTRWLAWEQVPAVLPVWQACAGVLAAEGWHTWAGYLYSEQYDVPQTRKRAFMLASRDHSVGQPPPTASKYHQHSPLKLDPGIRPWASMAEALGFDFDEMDQKRGQGMLERHGPRRYRASEDPAPTITSRFPKWYYRNGTFENAARRPLDAPAPTVFFGTAKNDVRWMPDGSERFAQQSDNEPDYTWPFNRPATVVAGRGMVGAPGATANRFNQSTKSRNDGVRVTVQEAGVLQSFPADYPWQGNASAQYLQVGNAVPPLMAAHVLSHVAYGVV